MQSKTTINIELDGRHYFQIDINENVISQRTQEIITDLKARFRLVDGFAITATHWHCCEGRDI